MPLTRRELLKGMGAGAAVFGTGGVGSKYLIPFIQQPDNIVPGLSAWYATSCRECPAGCGMVLRNRDSHVVKCEGNPLHPINRGRLCARGQAALQALYDPDRLKAPLRRNAAGVLEPVSWDHAYAAIGDMLTRHRGRIAMISDLQTGSLDALIRTFLRSLGSDRYIIYEPINYEDVKAASGGVVPRFNIGGSDYLISFAADFLETWVSPVEYARQFATIREVKNNTRTRFVYVGPRISMTAANADERIIVPPGTEWMVAEAIAGTRSPDDVEKDLGVSATRLKRIARDFAAAGAPLALPGGGVRSARAAMALNKGGLVDRTRPHAVTNIASSADVSGLLTAMENGAIDVLFVSGSNPAFYYPDTERFNRAIRRVPVVISLSSFRDETTMLAHWVLPSNTPLESWGDYQPYPDTINTLQPTMSPLYDTRMTGDILLQLAKAAGVATSAFGAPTFYEYLRRRHGAPVAAGESADASAPQWENPVRIGGSWPGASPTGNVTPATGYLTIQQPDLTALSAAAGGAAAGGAAAAASAAPAAGAGAGGAAPAGTTGTLPEGPSDAPKEKEIRLHFFPHPYLYDGRGANKRWLQELPEPVTKAAWDSWAEIHPDTAKELGIPHQGPSQVQITSGGVTVSLPAFVWPGVAKNTIAVPLGQGHSAYGRYAKGTGVNLYPLLTAEHPTVKASGSGGGKGVIRMMGAESQYGREVALTTYLGEPVKHEEITMPLKSGYKWEDFYPGHEHNRYRWAMIVDMNKCIGCRSCVAACYAENNIPTVGVDGMRRRRNMAWLRIDNYIDWDSDNSPFIFQPMLCQHCDNAPCESVCPVFAASHDEGDGINQQVYNRCVGTRYCSNNCPYKVRRFNWFDYKWPEPLNWQLNPDVTVRCRGVMEKCTFCVQRVRQAGIRAARERRQIRDGEVTPACVQTCPAGVYTFGNLLDPNSRVSKIIREDPRAYQVLHELNTKSAVIYLKRVVEK